MQSGVTNCLILCHRIFFMYLCMYYISANHLVLLSWSIFLSRAWHALISVSSTDLVTLICIQCSSPPLPHMASVWKGKMFQAGGLPKNRWMGVEALEVRCCAALGSRFGPLKWSRFNFINLRIQKVRHSWGGGWCGKCALNFGNFFVKPSI